MSTFYWYDLETFGINARKDRIAQFAGIRTDENLNPIGSPDVFFCKPHEDYLPDPNSCLITGITPQVAMEKGIGEVEFAERIHAIFSHPETCAVGYNSIRFDDEFIRFLFYRNLYDPYRREYAEGNSRWDIIDLLRACFALRPDGITWPTREDGAPSFKLEDLAQANKLQHTSAHDALSDVEATIQVAQLVCQHQPRLFHFYHQLRAKSRVSALLNWQQLEPIVHVSGMIPASKGCLSIMLPLNPHPRNANGIVCYDLAASPDLLLGLDVEQIRARVYTPEKDLADGQQRIPLKTIHLNKSPFVAPLSVLKNVDLERIECNLDVCLEHVNFFREHPQVITLLTEVFNQSYEAKSSDMDVDSMLYSGFFSPQERQQLDQLRESEPELLLQHNMFFKDTRAEPLIWRYAARNHPQILSKEDRARWREEVLERMQTQYGKSFEKWFSDLQMLKSEHNEESKKQIIEQCDLYAQSLLQKYLQ